MEAHAIPNPFNVKSNSIRQQSCNNSNYVDDLIETHSSDKGAVNGERVLRKLSCKRRRLVVDKDTKVMKFRVINSSSCTAQCTLIENALNKRSCFV